MHQILAKLPIKCSHFHDESHISFYPYVFCCQSVMYSSHVPGPVMIIASLARWNRKSKDVTYPLRANEKFVIPNLSHHFVPMNQSHTWFWYGSDLIGAKSALQQICCLYLCLNFLWWLVNFIQVVCSPSCIFRVFVLEEIGKKNLLEYMEEQILDPLSARMRQQPENVDHRRCSPIKTLC